MAADVVDGVTCDAVAIQLSQSNGAGSRRLLSYLWCQELALHLQQHPVLRPLLPANAVAVQCTLFDKSPSTNWLVGFHQDRSIPVRTKVGGNGLVGWSEKEGRLYVQPPATVLVQLIAVRIHIDDCPLASGALRVIPGSHRWGVLTTFASGTIAGCCRRTVRPRDTRRSARDEAAAASRLLEVVRACAPPCAALLVRATPPAAGT